jgi:hypothetical protein
MAQPSLVETEKPRGRRKWLLLIPIVLALAWWLWPDGRLAKARELREELFSEASQSLSPEDRRAKFEQLRDMTRNLSDADRRAMFQDRQKRQEDDLRLYAQMSPAEKKQRLDRDIKRQQEFAQRMQNNPNGGGGPGFGGGGPGGPGGAGRPSTPQDQEQRRKQRLDNTTPEFRELRDQYHRDLTARRQELGLPPNPPGRRGR